jgi:hypothetical protein
MSGITLGFVDVGKAVVIREARKHDDQQYPQLSGA